MADRPNNATSTSNSNNIPVLILTATPYIANDTMPSSARRPRNSTGSSLKPASVFGSKTDSLDVSELDHSTSTFGDDNDDDMPALMPNDRESSFMKHLEGSLLLEDDSSSESSYWSSSEDEESQSDSDEDDQSYTDHNNISSDNDPGLSTASDHSKSADEPKKERRKRNNSVLSLDAMLKVQMQLGDVKKPSTPLDKQARRRGRRLGKEYTATTLGALARKVGSSTGNEEIKQAAKGFRRTESSSNIPQKSRPKFMHVQQAGSIQGQQAPPLRGSLRSSIRGSTIMVDESVRSRRNSKYPEENANVKPRDHYLKLLKKSGITAPLVKYDELESFFLPISPEDKAAFDMELVGAVRDQNMEKLQALYSAGHPMQARSQFGESLVHICARRGTPEMLRFLLSLKGEGEGGNAGVSCRVCCDYGRTPLHDAAWSTHAVSLEMMKILIMDCPDLLLVLDKRGFMPLDYIPKSRWEQCCAWLDRHQHILMPTGVLFGDSDSESSSSEEEDSEEESESGEESD